MRDAEPFQYQERMVIAAQRELRPPGLSTNIRHLSVFLLMLFVLGGTLQAAEPSAQTTSLSVQLTITSPLELPNVPMDPKIDFGALIEQAELKGVLDPNSIRVIDSKTKKRVSHATTEDFAYGDHGRVEWVIKDPSHAEYEIEFDVVPRRPMLLPAELTPRIGNGDLLRYNAGVPRPMALPYPSRLIDLTGDGKRDLVGCWNYAYRPGWPWDGIICYPRVGEEKDFEFGDLVRIRYETAAKPRELRHFRSIYMHADFADFNNDGQVDLAYSPKRGDQTELYLNTGRRDAGGMPVFTASGGIPRKGGAWEPCRAVDLNSDGAIDFVSNNSYVLNKNREGWPIHAAPAVSLNAGKKPCFFDVDVDGLLDAVCLTDGTGGEPRAARVAWRKNIGGEIPTFAPEKILEDIDLSWCYWVCAVSDGPRRGLLVGHDVHQSVSFFEQMPSENDKPRFKRFGKARSKSAVMSLSDQSAPCFCDWDADGDLDLLVGGGYGWPRIVINEGTNALPAYAEPRYILAQGKPIRILRDEIFESEHWHNMGYTFPVFTDWDGDELPDLLLPNETNRIFWYRNIGTRQQPAFGTREQIVCDGFPDSPQHRAASAKLSADKSVLNSPYPYQQERPFFWRTAAAFADFNGDGLTDLVTHDGYTRKATLFVQYRSREGELRLKKSEPLKLKDGRFLDDKIVNRSAHWTESFRSVDWDGDGLVDLIYSCAGAHHGIQDNGSMYLLRNCGTREKPLFENPVTFRCFGEPIRITNHGPHPWAGDIDGDGGVDLVAYVEWSVYPFYSHAALEMSQRPQHTLGSVHRR